MLNEALAGLDTAGELLHRFLLHLFFSSNDSAFWHNNYLLWISMSMGNWLKLKW